MFVEIGQHQIPVVIYREWRQDWRISLGKKTVHLRIPNLPSGALKGDPITWARNWLINKYRDDPSQFYHFMQSAPSDGKVYQTVYGNYTLRLIPDQGRRARGRIDESQIIINYPVHWNATSQKEVFPNLVSRIFAQAFRPIFVERIEMLNEIHFGYEFKSVSLKYNSSNWGSCSTKGNLNFSTRLFLAPEAVSDYVIIHELAHLKVPNHSEKFWQLVQIAMPEYEEHVVWLKEHGQHLYY